MTPAAKQLVHDLLGDEDFVEISTWADRVRADRPETLQLALREHSLRARAPTIRARDCVGDGSRRLRHRRHRARPRGDRQHRAARATPAPSRSSSSSISSATCTSRSTTSATRIAAATTSRRRSRASSRRPAAAIRISTRPGTPPSSLARRRMKSRTPPASSTASRSSRSTSPQPSTSCKWSLEARDLAVKHVYAYQGFVPGTPLAAPAKLDKAYQDAALPVIELQLTRAGVRLARILNAASVQTRKPRHGGHGGNGGSEVSGKSSFTLPSSIFPGMNAV